jgi:hypothetical protein
VTIGHYFFAQPDALTRLGLLRVSVGGVLLVLVASPTFGTIYADTMMRASYQRTAWFDLPYLGGFYTWLRALCIVTAAAVALGISLSLSAPLLLLSFLALDRYVSRFSPTIYANHAHLHVALLALWLAGRSHVLAIDTLLNPVAHGPADLERASAAISVLQASVATLYLQALISKLRVSGPAWFLQGRAFRAAIVFRGTSFGKKLLARPFALGASMVATLGFEGGFLPAALFQETHRALGIAGIVFHLSIYATLRISFWTLWFLFPALFIF